MMCVCVCQTQFHACQVGFSDQMNIKFTRYSPVQRTIEATSRRVAKASFTVLSSKPEVCGWKIAEFHGLMQ